MKNTFILIFSLPLILVFKLISPFKYYILRIYYFALARSKLKVSPEVQFDGPIEVKGTGKVIIGKKSRIGSNLELETMGLGVINIGENVRINKGGTIVSYSNIEIGNNTLIGEYVSIRDANHGISKEHLIKSQDHISKEIIIEDDVWIGRGTIILPGVKIGKGSIIGANSVVNKSIGEYKIAVGSPAKVIKDRT